MSGLRRTPLYAEHVALGGKMVDFSGWEMPIQYSGIIKESEHTRQEAAVFDTCHMGELIFSGDIGSSGLENILSFSIADIPAGRCKYGFLMLETGGIKDDVIVYKRAEDSLFIVVNAAPAESDFQYIKSRLKSGTLTDISDNTAKIDVQGPASADVLTELFGDNFRDLKFFGFKDSQLDGRDALISRTGYTGELGFELYVDNSDAVEIFRKIANHKSVIPAGLGARDILRTEMGLSLYGADIDEDTTPVQADLEMFVDYSKSFVGKEVLLSQKEAGTEYKKCAFIADSRRSPRHGFDIVKDNKNIGYVTSGVFSPMLKCGIGIGYVKSRYAETGTDFTVSKGRAKMNAEVCTLPFYKNASARKKL